MSAFIILKIFHHAIALFLGCACVWAAIRHAESAHPKIGKLAGLSLAAAILIVLGAGQ